MSNETPKAGEPYCCKIGCDQKADYEIRHGERIDDYTHACLAHIPDLMTDAPRHYIDKITD